MIYISLILISFGIFFIIYTLVIASEKKQIIVSSEKKEDAIKSYQSRATGKSDWGLEDFDSSENKKSTITSVDKYGTIKSEEESMPGLNSDTIDTSDIAKSTGDQDLFEDIEDIEDYSADNIDSGSSDSEFSENSFNESYAILFEDASNIFDYENNDSIIDSSLTEYSKIKRLGAGNLDVLKDGINFKSGEKHFRFDFHRISNIKSGENFVAIFIKGSNVARLFIIRKNTMLGTRLRQNYNNYLNSVG